MQVSNCYCNQCSGCRLAQLTCCWPSELFSAFSSFCRYPESTDQLFHHLLENNVWDSLLFGCNMHFYQPQQQASLLTRSPGIHQAPGCRTGVSVQLAGNEGFDPFSLLPPQELSVEAMAVVQCRGYDECYSKDIAKWGGNFGGGVLGLPGYVFVSISSWGMTTEEVLLKHEFSASSEGTAMFSFWNRFPEWIQFWTYCTILL